MQHEHHRRDRHVEQLLGHVLDLQHPAPAERRAAAERRSRAAGAGSRRAPCGAPPRRRRSRARSSGGGRCSCGLLLLDGVARRPAPRPGGRSARGRPRRGSAGRARSRRSATPDRASSATASARAVGVGARRRQRRRVGLEVDRAELAREQALGLRALLGVEQAHVQRAGADRRLELAGRALGDHLAVVDHRDARRRAGRPRRGTACRAGSSCPRPTSARMMSQTWLRERGSSPVVGSSRNISCGVTTMLAAMSSRRRMPPE